MPGFSCAHFVFAAAYGQLGEPQAATDAVRELLVVRPDFPAVAGKELAKWRDPQLVEHLLEGAGLEIASRESKANPAAGD